MRSIAFLTLTGTGTVIREWLTQLSTGAPAPELLLLVAALGGLGLQALHSERVRARTHPIASPKLPGLSQALVDDPLTASPSGAFSGA